jgi:uncharacterized DUF497 family protein
MRISFDPAKNARNIAERDLPFELVAQFEWNSAIAEEDRRKDYGERRVRVFGLIKKRLHVAVFTMRGEVMHVISLRKANQKEVKRYEQEKG